MDKQLADTHMHIVSAQMSIAVVWLISSPVGQIYESQSRMDAFNPCPTVLASVRLTQITADREPTIPSFRSKNSFLNHIFGNPIVLIHVYLARFSPFSFSPKSFYCSFAVISLRISWE